MKEARELSNVYRSFIILRSKEGLTSFNKNNFVNFSGEKKKKVTRNFPGCVYFLRLGEKQLYVVVCPGQESKDLYCRTEQTTSLVSRGYSQCYFGDEIIVSGQRKTKENSFWFEKSDSTVFQFV